MLSASLPSGIGDSVEAKFGQVANEGSEGAVSVSGGATHGDLPGTGYADPDCHRWYVLRLLFVAISSHGACRPGGRGGQAASGPAGRAWLGPRAGPSIGSVPWYSLRARAHAQAAPAACPSGRARRSCGSPRRAPLARSRRSPACCARVRAAPCAPRTRPLISSAPSTEATVHAACRSSHLALRSVPRAFLAATDGGAQRTQKTQRVPKVRSNFLDDFGPSASPPGGPLREVRHPARWLVRARARGGRRRSLPRGREPWMSSAAKPAPKRGVIRYLVRGESP